MDGIHPEVGSQSSRALRSGGSRWFALVAALSVSFLSWACTSQPTLSPTFDSDAGLARAVLERLAKRDVQGLLELSVNADEFEAIVWPKLPASRPGVNMRWSYVWNDSYTKSRAHLAQTLDSHGGRPYTFVSLGFSGPDSDYETYQISRKSYLVVRDEAGAEKRIRLFGSVIRQAGRSKVYSYIVD